LFRIAYLQQSEFGVLKEEEHGIRRCCGCFLFTDAVKNQTIKKTLHDQIAQAFNRKDLIIYTNRKTSKTDYLFNLNLENSALLLMSSGNYGGLNFDEVKVDSIVQCIKRRIT
jgi:hypothetical protein